MQQVAAGAFREDLLARIDLWTFALPGLAERREDISPNLEYELERFAQATGRKVTINREARDRFLRFATSPTAKWLANFRDLNAALTRMATLAPRGRITVQEVDEEIGRLQFGWRCTDADGSDLVEEVLGTRASELDRFDRVQLKDVLRVCRSSSASPRPERALFAESRKRRRSTNDADRLRKYLARFQLEWETVRANG